jgi:drug/metabolite transporter (DMT)-like permease
LLVYLSTDWVSGFARTALFTLVPVFSIVLEPHLGDPAARPIRGALPVSLIAVLGALLVFPTINPASSQAISAIAAVILAAVCIAAANCYAVAIFRAPESPSAATSTAVAASTGAISLGIASLLLERPTSQLAAFAPELLWAAAIELPGLLLLFWLMQRLSAARVATRFVLGPLVAVPIGALLIHWPFATRTCLGLLGMAAGSGYLLFAPEAAAEPATFLGGDPRD